MNKREFLLGTGGLLAAGAGAGAGTAATGAVRPARSAETTAPPTIRASNGRRRPFDTERFIADCIEANRETAGQAATQEVLARHVADPDAILKALGEPTKGGLQTLYASDDLTIMNIVWPPLFTLVPHNHNMWALIGVYTGREDNIFWRANGSLVEAVGAANYGERDAGALPEDVIHSVLNPIEKYTGAIHIYGGDFLNEQRSQWDPETLTRTQQALSTDAARRRFAEADERYDAWRNGCPTPAKS